MLVKVDGEGVLHHAISVHEVKVIELLLKLGANLKDRYIIIENGQSVRPNDFAKYATPK